MDDRPWRCTTASAVSIAALTHFRAENGRKQWLLVKMDDEAADARRNPVNTAPESVLSGRTLAQIADEARRSG